MPASLKIELEKCQAADNPLIDINDYDGSNGDLIVLEYMNESHARRGLPLPAIRVSQSKNVRRISTLAEFASRFALFCRRAATCGPPRRRGGYHPPTRAEPMSLSTLGRMRIAPIVGGDDPGAPFGNGRKHLQA